jgi:Protease inhibitor Inh
MRHRMPTIRAAAGFLIALLLADCGGGLFGESVPSSAIPTGDDMAGRWFLAAPDAPPCGMNFGGAPGAQQGTVSPDGGCPGKFFTSRRWTLEQGALVIADHENKPLAHLNFSGGRFEGQANAGMAVTLSR